MLKLLKSFMTEEDGLGTVEIVIIIAVLVGVALIFRDSLVKFVSGLVDSVFNTSNVNDKIDIDDIRKNKK